MSPISMKKTFALLQLAMKYQIDSIRDEATSLIELLYPSSTRDPDIEGRVTEWTYATDAVVVINISRKYNLHSLLPGAFLACCFLTNSGIAKALRGSEAGGNEDLTKLSPEDLERCLDGREILQTKYHDRLYLDLSDDCLDPPLCTAALDRWREENVRDCTKDIFSLDFNPSERFDWLPHLQVCLGCELHHQQVDEAARREIEDKLATFFGL